MNELADQIEEAVHVKIQMSETGSEILTKDDQERLAKALRFMTDDATNQAMAIVLHYASGLPAAQQVSLSLAIVRAIREGDIRLRMAAKEVCSWDWEDNDDEPVAAIAALEKELHRAR